MSVYVVVKFNIHKTNNNIHNLRSLYIECICDLLLYCINYHNQEKLKPSFMFKLDFSDIQNRGHRINQFRLFHSIGLRSSKVDELGQQFKNAGDIISEKKIIVGYLTENSEIRFTLYYLFAALMFAFIIPFILSLLFMWHGFFLSMAFLPAVFIFYRLALKFREDFILGNVGVHMTESFYDAAIDEKYNFQGQYSEKEMIASNLLE